MKRIYAFYLFLGIALATPGHAEEYYTYRDPDGKLTISNKRPPAGSKIIKQQNLPELADSPIQDPKESEDVRLNENSKASVNPPRKK
jgi:Domain of unknown function (DUF4124)